MTDLRRLIAQECWADEEEAASRFCITLVLWSVTSVWILSSVSFFSSWQLFSLRGDTKTLVYYLASVNERVSHCLPSFLDGLLQQFLRDHLLLIVLGHHLVHLDAVSFLHCILILLKTGKKGHIFQFQQSLKWIVKL